MRNLGFIGFLATVIAVFGGAAALVGSAVGCGKTSRRDTTARTQASRPVESSEAVEEPRVEVVEERKAEEPVGGNSSAPPPPPKAPPPPPPSALRLLSTHVSPDGEDDAATLVHPDSGFGGMYAVGEPVEGRWVLSEVGHTVAVLRDDASGAEHVIDLALPSATGQSAPRAVQIDDVTPTGPQTVSRADLAKAAADPKAIGARARVGKDGTIKLASVKKNSPAYKLGFRKGDVLVSVAGVKLTSPDAAVDAMAKVKTASRAAVVVNRNGTEMTFEFNLSE